MNKNLSHQQVANILEFLSILNNQCKDWIVRDKKDNMFMANRSIGGFLALLSDEITIDTFLFQYAQLEAEKQLFYQILELEYKS